MPRSCSYLDQRPASNAYLYRVPKAPIFAVIERTALHSAYFYQKVSIGVLATPSEKHDVHLAA